MKINFRLSYLSVLLLFIISTQYPVSADTLQNTNYTLDDFSDSHTKKTLEEFSQTEKKSQEYNNENQKESNNIKGAVKRSETLSVGKEWSTITASSNEINFGVINPGEAIIRSLELGVANNGNQGQSIFVTQNHNLSSDHDQIPQTTCDNGSCTSSYASLWMSPLTFGVGFRCSYQENKSCADDFVQKDSYRNIANSLTASTLASSVPYNTSKKIRFIFKVNISGNQPIKEYTNEVTITALPGY